MEWLLNCILPGKKNTFKRSEYLEASSANPSDKWQISLFTILYPCVYLQRESSKVVPNWTLANLFLSTSFMSKIVQYINWSVQPLVHGPKLTHGAISWGPSAYLQVPHRDELEPGHAPFPHEAKSGSFPLQGCIGGWPTLRPPPHDQIPPPHPPPWVPDWHHWPDPVHRQTGHCSPSPQKEKCWASLN